MFKYDEVAHPINLKTNTLMFLILLGTRALGAPSLFLFLVVVGMQHQFLIVSVIKFDS